MGRLDSKIALITGGASGIGAETARRMLAEGACVILADLQVERGEKLAAELGESARFVPLDVTRENDWKRTLAEAESLGSGRNGRVNCAGGSKPAPIDHASFEHWRETMSINADGVFLGCRYGVDALRRSGGGSIVNVSSLAATYGLSLIHI